MEYTEVDVRLKELNPFADILVARLDEIQFESYCEDENGLKGYVQSHLLNMLSLEKILNEMSALTEISYTVNIMKKENWNKLWESNYDPAFINDICVIRSHFHNAMPDFRYEIIITPKMSFGTGHHETTSLVMCQMFDLELKGKSVLDMGSGTGVISILASMLGAFNPIGIDSDEWAFKNAIENSNLNKISNINFIHGDVDAIPDVNFDVIIANINRNIILQDISKYVDVMKENGELILSGFLKQDIPLILEKTDKFALELVILKNKNKWQMLYLRKA